MFAFQIQFVYLIKLDKYGLLSQQMIIYSQKPTYNNILIYRTNTCLYKCNITGYKLNILFLH